MLLLHVSDIHFRHPICNTNRDPDRPFRTRLIQDARDRVKSLGSVDAILVGGDIAFAGKPQEYVAALKWLYELADACGCARNRIFVIPGNHDVDRDVIRADLSVQNAQRAIVNAASADDKEWQIERQLQHAETGPALLRPIAAYNDFAFNFSGNIFAPERLSWKADLPFRDGITLRIHGLNSTILSGWRTPEGQNDVERDLYVEPQQTALDPVDDVVNLVMCHHPPDWLTDGDRVADDVTSRCTVHLFGHKHRQRIVRDPRYVTFYAGAVNPERQAKDWRPGYNMIDLSLGRNKTGQPQLEVAAHLLEWQTSPEGFKAIKDDDCEIHHAEVRLRNVNPRPSAAVVGPASPVAEPPSDGVEAVMSDDRARSIVLRFWQLDMSDRREISRTLKLNDPAEAGLPPSERFGRVLIRAGQKNLLEELDREIAKRERR
ncbi:metallophosphoesterase [Bradyrhizobium sp. 171]|nr:MULTISPECIES: metallophosphoesterase [unclassified Bradyrhizobium]MCK1418135.1 metallophosphoesterase [Bradyrhizobium sp. CW4]MCK1430567.1 metallophosphoesterase [Bradyrhizobium sp. 87]MCK1538245.1 metallophosphoesterase [Bradyrhizobium sp. 176]MCK1560300.1 metallophosphoesterase [Bradyrhizobium sp. 171]MCK1575786.1 metallophosphoesterase [Bradyrhizobium sp. 174]